MSNQKIPKAAQNKVGEYALRTKFPGYSAREDKTTIDPSFMVSPSQNVKVGTSGRIALVEGYTGDGAGSVIIDSGIQSNYDFNTFKGNVRNIRVGFLSSNGNDGRMQYRYVDSLGVVTWIDLMTSLSTVSYNFTSFWDSTNLLKILLSVNGSNNIFSWNGAVTTFASADTGTGYIATLDSVPTNGGTGYVVGDVVTISGGTATATVTSISGGNTNAMLSFSIVFQGSGYIVGDVVSTTGGSGTGATILVTSVDSNGSITSATVNSGGSGYGGYAYYNMAGGHGTNSQILITSTGGNVVTGVSLTTTSTGYSTGTGKTTTGGTGSSLTLNITAVAVNSIVKQGTNSWIQDGFYSTTSSITINGIDFAYTAAVGNRLVGVLADPTVPTLTVGMEIHQTPVTTTLQSMTGINDLFGPTVIGCGRQNQVYLGTYTSNNLYISKVNSFIDYSFSTPTRVVGEGALIPLDAPATGFVSLENRNDTNAFDLYVSEGLNTWSVIRTTLSSDLVNESIERIPMKVTPLQGAQSQKFISKMKNHIIYLAEDLTTNFLGYISYQNVPETVDFGYKIIDDLTAYDFTDGQIFYYKNYIYLAIPKEGLIRIFNMTDQTKQTTSSIRGVEDVDADQPWFWEAPIQYPISGFYITEDGTLCGHGYNTSESYVLFNGGSFNGQDIDANATFAFDDKGDRTQSKGSDELWIEGYILQNTKLNATIGGDLDAFTTSQTVVVDGNDSQIVSFGAGAHSLGKNPLGSQPLGGAQTSNTTLPAWFHVAKTYVETPFYLEQLSFESKGVDLDWELITFGTNARFTPEGNNSITQ